MVEIPAYINDETLKIPSDGKAVVTLPWAHEALTADFFRVGPDLLIIAKNGEKILLEGYFLNLQSKDVYTAGGAKIAADLISKLCGNPLPGVYAQMQQPEDFNHTQSEETPLLDDEIPF